MFQLIIVPSNSASNSSLFFRTQEKAESTYNNIHDIIKGAKVIEVVRQTDEFGITVAIDKANISYVLLVDMFKQQELQLALRGAAAVPSAAEPIIASATIDEQRVILEGSA